MPVRCYFTSTYDHTSPRNTRSVLFSLVLGRSDWYRLVESGTVWYSLVEPGRAGLRYEHVPASGGKRIFKNPENLSGKIVRLAAWAGSYDSPVLGIRTEVGSGMGAVMPIVLELRPVAGSNYSAGARPRFA